MNTAMQLTALLHSMDHLVISWLFCKEFKELILLNFWKGESYQRYGSNNDTSSSKCEWSTERLHFEINKINKITRVGTVRLDNTPSARQLSATLTFCRFLSGRSRGLWPSASLEFNFTVAVIDLNIRNLEYQPLKLRLIGSVAFIIIHFYY